jgi:hypothetical protein
VQRLWKEKRGEVEPEDFSDNLIVQLGVATETLNRAWYERNTGRAISDVQRRVQHPTLGGFVSDLDAVFEAKFMLPWSLSEEAIITGGQRCAHLSPAPLSLVRVAQAHADAAAVLWNKLNAGGLQGVTDR